MVIDLTDNADLVVPTVVVLCSPEIRFKFISSYNTLACDYYRDWNRDIHWIRARKIGVFWLESKVDNPDNYHTSTSDILCSCKSYRLTESTQLSADDIFCARLTTLRGRPVATPEASETRLPEAGSQGVSAMINLYAIGQSVNAKNRTSFSVDQYAENGIIWQKVQNLCVHWIFLSLSYNTCFPPFFA